MGQPSFRGSTLGQHMRHTLDHVEALCNGMAEGLINYDLRIRATNVESSPDTAAERCQLLITRLSQLKADFPPASAVSSISSCSSNDLSQSQPSSFGREIQFVASHTIHHFAIIAAICHQQDIDVSSEFGIAPSTLKHRETISAQ